MPTRKCAVKEASQLLHEAYWCVCVCVCVCVSECDSWTNCTKLQNADDSENIICTARCCPLIVHLARKRCSRLGGHRKSMSASVYLVPSVLRRSEETNELISVLEACQLSACVSPELTFCTRTRLFCHTNMPVTYTPSP